MWDLTFNNHRATLLSSLCNCHSWALNKDTIHIVYENVPNKLFKDNSSIVVIFLFVHCIEIACTENCIVLKKKMYASKY